MLKNSCERPLIKTNAWVADPEDKAPAVTLRWDAPKTISKVVLCFDADYDHPMETVQMGHPERVVPFCVKHYRIRDDKGAVLFEECDNHLSRTEISFPSPVSTSTLTVEIAETRGTPAALFKIRAL
jgi:hypothetical protein